MGNLDLFAYSWPMPIKTKRPWVGLIHQPFGKQPNALTDCATETGLNATPRTRLDKLPPNLDHDYAMSLLNTCGHFFLSFSSTKVAVSRKRTTSPERVVNDPLISFYSCLTCFVISNSCRQNNQPTTSLKKFVTFL